MNPQEHTRPSPTDQPEPQRGHDSGRLLPPAPRAYDHTSQAQPSQQPAQPTSQTHADTTPPTQEADAQIHNPQAYDWQQYHAAWQQYYQQYYQRYYQHMLGGHQQPQNQTSSEVSTPQNQTIVGSDNIAEPASRFLQLRQGLLARIKERARKARRSNHFIPIVSALIVGALFLLLQFNRVIAAQVEAYISPGSTVNTSDTILVDPVANASVGAEPKLLIPKINVNVPVVYDVTTVDDRQIQQGLERGVVRYNLAGANSLPGQAGNMVILGHSSNDVFDPGAYKFTFVLLERLKPGDLFYLHYQGKRYAYRVSEHKIIKPTEWKVLQQNNGKPTVILVTCTPTGTATNRLLVYGEQISPDPASAAAKPAATQESNPAEIPGNSPTFFERLGDILF